MQKTYALFGLAASLVVGAVVIDHWRSSRMTAPPPPVAVVPTPPPTTIPVPARPLATPGSTVAFGDLVRLDASLSNGYVTTTGSDEMFLRIGLDAAKVHGVERLPMVLAIVIDRSGSMDGDKMDKTRLAAKQLVDRLSDEDRLSVISYATDYSVDLALVKVGHVGRAKIRRIIDDLYVGGGTNLSGGLKAGLDEVARVREKNVVRRVVLMSDGNANQGETDPSYLARVAQRARVRGTTITSLGVGVDFNEDLMTLLAESGGGAYYYARNADAIAAALQAELDGLVAVAARGVEVALEVADGVTIKEIYGYPTELRHGRIVIPVGDMASGEHRQIVARVSIRPTGEGAHALTNVSLAYTPAQASTVVSQNGNLTVVATDDRDAIRSGARTDILETVEEIMSAQVRRQAAAQFSSGNKNKAKKSLQQQIQRTRSIAQKTNSPALLQQAVELEETLQAVDQFDAASDAGKDLVKREKHRARVLYTE